MQGDYVRLLIICPLVFLAGIIDAAAGGGGLISLPAYIVSGMPIHMAYGTNKFANAIGTFVASVKFFKSANEEKNKDMSRSRMYIFNEKVIKPIMLIVIVLLFGKIGFSIF